MMIGAVSVLAAGGNKAAGKQTGETKADSMVYDEPVQWRIFSIDGPGVAFALQGDLLWISSGTQVASMGIKNTKKNELTRYKALGAVSSEGITGIAIDKQGNVWFGGKNGVIMKNGAQFTGYTAENGLSDNTINGIVATPDGNVWVGTDNGLNCYSAGSWKKYSTGEGLASDKIQTLLVDKSGSVWAGTDKGISVFTNGKWTTHSTKNGMSWNDTRALGLDPRNGSVWAFVGQKDINTWNGKSWDVYMDIAPGIKSIMIDSQGRVWCASSTGLIKFNGDEWVNDPSKLGVPAKEIYQMYKDEAGNLWYGMETGVIRLENPYPH